MPINNLKLFFDTDTPEWVFIDEDYDGNYDDNEIKFYSDNNELNLDLSLYSNRINLSNYYNLTQNHINVTSTKFNIISSNGNVPKKIEANNIFLNNNFTVRYEQEIKNNAINSNSLNKIIHKKERV